MKSKITQIRQNIANYHLVFRQKFNFPSQQKINIFNHSDRLEITLLNQIKTKNNQNYQYLLILLETGNPKYTVYAEENETKQSIIYGYDEKGEEPRNTQIKENISESEFAEIGKQFINQYVEEELKSKVLEIVEKLFNEYLEVNTEKVESNFPEDLVEDALDTVELIMALEEEFDLEIPDEEAECLLTVQQIYNYICNAIINQPKEET